jgi:hypothetical protein
MVSLRAHAARDLSRRATKVRGHETVKQTASESPQKVSAQFSSVFAGV